MTTMAALLGALFLKPLLVLGAAALVAARLRRQSAGARHSVWTGAIVATLVLPILGAALPLYCLASGWASWCWSIPGPRQWSMGPWSPGSSTPT